jgi:large subunit ribosomal protein L29
MKGVQAKDLRGNEPGELERTLAKLQGDLFQHRLKRSTNQLENTMLIRNTRRDIAKIHTVLAELKSKKPSGKTAAAQPDQPEKEK